MILFLAHVVNKVTTTMMMNQMDLTILAIYTIISINLLMMMKEMKKLFVMIPIYSYSIIDRNCDVLPIEYDL